MLIDCPACARSYHVGRAEIGVAGRTVVCPRCAAQWFVAAEGIGSLPPPADELRTPSFGARPAVRTPAAAGSAPRLPSWRRTRSTAAVMACLVLAMASIGARAPIVRAMPRTAGLYAAIGLPVNLRGLAIVAVTPRRLAEAPADVTVTGEIRNVTRDRIAVPRLTYEIRDAAGMALLTWTERAAGRTLAVGRSLPFASTPHPLPAEAHSVLVRFEDADGVPPMRLAGR